MIFQDYFTSELEIKPQLRLFHISNLLYYFTSELEIKPQPSMLKTTTKNNYFTSELEIKPQLQQIFFQKLFIILHQN